MFQSFPYSGTQTHALRTVMVFTVAVGVIDARKRRSRRHAPPLWPGNKVLKPNF